MTGTQWETVLEGWLKALPLASFRNEPKMAGKIKVAGGTPDYTALLAGKCHLIECKKEGAVSFDLGNLVPPASGAKEGNGVTSKQSNALTKWELHGGHGWIAARLEVPAATPKKQGSLLTVARKEHVIQRLVPWADWRRLLLGGTKSVPYNEFAELGLPLRGPDDLMAALKMASLDAHTPPRLQ
jgi:hypothetical protein